MSELNELMSFLNLIVFGIIGMFVFISITFTVTVLVKHYRPSFCSPSFCTPNRDAVVSIVGSSPHTPSQSAPPHPQARSQPGYITLEDHLDMLDSPERLVPAPREPVGHTLEFLPEDNSVIRVEGTGTKITRITKTKITIGDVVSRHESYTVHHGEMNNGRVLVYVVQLGGRVFQEVKDYVKQRDAELPLLIEHPRYIRYLGTCFNPSTLEAYVLSDHVAGCSLLDIQKTAQLRELLDLTEEDKVQAALDIAEAVYYIHNLSRPVVHQHLAATNLMVDGETLRARLRAAEIQGRLEDMVWCQKHGGIKDFLDRSNILHMELAPEVFLYNKTPDLKSDMWGLGGVILEVLFDQKLWDDQELLRKQGQTEGSSTNSFETLRRAMERGDKPSLTAKLETANPKLKFLTDCFHYTPGERPSVTFLLRGLHQFLAEVTRDRKAQAPYTSLLFPGRRILSALNTLRTDPLVRQQVEWSVRQETGYKRRAFLVANRTYLGKHWPSLSANPMNDIKDIGSLLHKGGYSTENTFENIHSAGQFEDTLQSYIDAVNKEPGDVDIIVFYFSGYGLTGQPERLVKKRELGIFTDRAGILYDLALVMCNETLFPVAKMQTMLAQLNPRVKRKLLILDCRLGQVKLNAEPQNTALGTRSYSRIDSRMSESSLPSPSSSLPSSSPLDWQLPKIPEETTEKLISMFTMRTTLTDPNTIPKAVDSHPRRMNGFLTGCLIQVLQDNIPNISDIPKFLNNQMKSEGRRSRAHRGIECTAEFSHVGNIWDAPLLTH